jgi:hypothetical protein
VSPPDDDDFYYVDSWHAIYRGTLDLDPPLYTRGEETPREASEMIVRCMSLLWHCFVISRFIPVTIYARPVSHFYLYVFDVCKVCWIRTYLRLIRPSQSLKDDYPSFCISKQQVMMAERPASRDRSKRLEKAQPSNSGCVTSSSP